MSKYLKYLEIRPSHFIYNLQLETKRRVEGDDDVRSSNQFQDLIIDPSKFQKVPEEGEKKMLILDSIYRERF